MDLFANLALGFDTAFTLQNLLYCLIGCVLGTLIGVLPGLGPIATIAMLLPATYALPPIAALIMLAGIYYGSQYGGSTTAILLNIPGETSSVVTAIDGYQMARNGRAGVALFTAGIGSFFAGCVATLVLAAFAAPLSQLAFKFGPAEYFSLMVLGLIGAVVLASGSLVKAIGMIVLGLLMGLIGTDVNSGASRYAFDIPELSDGIGFVAVAMGVFGFAEIMGNLEKSGEDEGFLNKMTTMIPTKQDIKRMIPSILRGTTIGSILGILPGGGAALAAFGAYSVEKKSSKYSHEFGKGAMTIHNIQPGPLVMTSNPALFWGLIASMWIGNVMLILLNLPLIGIWVKLLKIPYRFMYPAILVFCCIGVYTVNNTVFDVYVTAAFGIIGYIFFKLGCEPPPLLLGFVLGPMMEENFRRALLLSRGDFTTFLTRPLSLGLLIASAHLVVIEALPL